jgi:hypothetical protein
MREARHLGICMTTVWLVLCLAPVALCDVSPGDVIDSSNWQKIEGLVPDSVLNWVKKGDFILGIGELDYDLAATWPDFASEAMQTNVGKYGLDEDGGIVDLKTGKMPKYIIGLPFPEIDPKDRGAAVKIMHNNHYVQYVAGDLRLPLFIVWVGRGGYEREIGAVGTQAAMDGWPGARDRGNPDRMEKLFTTLVTSPYDVQGTAIMTWRYLDAKKQDDSFGYIPAIRRVRRMSPANRSDSFVGSDITMDDANGYDGKVEAFEWKLVGQQEAILPHYDSKPASLVQNEEGEWQTTRDAKETVYGYRKDGWQGAPWAPTNFVWIKRPVYIMEMKSKDKYYNYGTHYLWIDAETYAANYKVIYDRSGVYWRTFMKADTGCTSKDKKIKLHSIATELMVCDRTDHATVHLGLAPNNILTFYAQVDLNEFSLAGFQALCK